MSELTYRQVFEKVMQWPNRVFDDLQKPMPNPDEIPSQCDGNIYQAESFQRCIQALCRKTGQNGVADKNTQHILDATTVPLAIFSTELVTTKPNLETLVQQGKTTRWLQWHAARFAIDNIPGLCGPPHSQPVFDASPVPVESKEAIRRKIQTGCAKKFLVEEKSGRLPLLIGATLLFALRIYQRILVPSSVAVEMMLTPQQLQWGPDMADPL